LAGTGQLERAVLQVLWDSPGPVSGRAVLTALAAQDGPGRELAITTVLTVLDRLRRKGLVRRERSGRAHLYEAARSREDYVADLMLAALGQAPDRGAALARFLGAASPADADHLRRALDQPPPGPPAPGQPAPEPGRPARDQPPPGQPPPEPPEPSRSAGD
jgi:predicted transcriptional regulator